MSGINKVILVGNVGQEPEVRVMQSGENIVNFSIATSETWKDRVSGEPREKTEWHKVAIFGKLAEIAGRLLHKGAKVYLEGQLQTRKWQDKNGQERYTTEVVLKGFNGVLELLSTNAQSHQESGVPNSIQSHQQVDAEQSVSHSQGHNNWNNPTSSNQSVDRNNHFAPDIDFDDVPF